MKDGFSATVLFFIVFGVVFSAYSQFSTTDSLRQELDRHANDSMAVRILSLMANEYARTDLAMARDLVHQAIATAHRLNTRFALSGCYAQLTTQHQQAGALDSAAFYLDKLREISERLPPDTAAIANYHITAGLFHKNKGELELALTHILEAIDHLVEPRHELSKAGQYLNAGNIYLNRGELGKAAEYHLGALRLFEKLGNKRGQSFCLQSLGSDFLRLKRYEESRKYYEHSLTLKRELSDLRGMVSSWMGLGNVLVESGDISGAINYYELALRQARELKITNEEARALFDLGIGEKALGRHASARAHLREALSIARLRGDSLLSSRAQVELAGVGSLSNAGDHETLLNKMRTAEAHGDMLGTAESYLKLAEWNYANKRFEEAFELLKTHYKINDSLRGESVEVRLKQLEEEYENEKNQRQIALLRKDQELKEAIIDAQRARQQIILAVLVLGIIVMALLVNYYRTLNRSQRLIEIEKVRNNIARDLHDDIGSVLSGIQILSQVALKGGDPRLPLQRISEHASKTMESMSDIVWSISPENDTMDQMMVRMKEFATEMLEPRNIAFTFDEMGRADQTLLSIEMRKNLFLIFKEAINNVSRHSQATEVNISLQGLGKHLVLRVRDNGNGFDADRVQKGNGLDNMSERARSLGGSLRYVTRPGNGTEVVVELPLT